MDRADDVRRKPLDGTGGTVSVCLDAAGPPSISPAMEPRLCFVVARLIRRRFSIFCFRLSLALSPLLYVSRRLGVNDVGSMGEERLLPRFFRTLLLNADEAPPMPLTLSVAPRV